MKISKIIQILVISFSLVVFFSACGESTGTESQEASSEETHDHDEADHDHEHDNDAIQTAHGEGKAHTSAYVCPMHCEGSGSEEAGNCPVCGMAYVPQAEHVEDGHTHAE